MKRLLPLGVIVIAILTLIAPPAKTMIPCEQANAACDAQAQFEIASCLTLQGQDGYVTYEEAKYCSKRGEGIFIGCMDAHGCPVVN